MTVPKLFSLLELVAAREHPVTLADLAAACGAPRPTVHRWLASLTDAGLLQRAPDRRRFELAPRASQLAFSILGNQPGAAVRHDILQHVARDVGESCNLTVLHGLQVTYIDRVEAMWPLRISFQRGSQVPVHCSASGKLFLAMMSPAKREALLNGCPLDRFTDNTLGDRDALMQELKAIRRQRYALDREEYLAGLVCLAVPIFSKAGSIRSCIAALAIQAPVGRLDSERILDKLPKLQAAAQSLADTLDS